MRRSLETLSVRDEGADLVRLMGRARALEVMLSAEDYDAELAERYGWINRAMSKSGSTRSRWRRSEICDAIPSSFSKACKTPSISAEPKTRCDAASRPEPQKWLWPGCLELIHH